MKKQDRKDVLVPFWEKKENKNPKNFLKRYNLKNVVFYLKSLIYLFSGIMIFWSFMQSVFSNVVGYNPNPGVGLEFAYLPGTSGTGDIKFDASSWSLVGPKYHAFFEPNYNYGPFLSWFVYPVARMFIFLIYSFNKSSSFLSTTGLDAILSMIIIMFMMRFVAFWATLRSSLYLEKQTLHQPNIDAINAKYDKYSFDDKQAKIKKHQEITEYNKKNGLKPFASLENFFISTPIFLIVFKIITITRPLKFTVLFGIWDLSKTPFNMFTKHLLTDGWKYLLLCLVIIPVNFFSQRFSGILSDRRNNKSKKQEINKDSQAYKMKKIQQIMTILFLFFTFFWSTGLAVYYFFNSIFTIIQNLIIHFILVKKKKTKINLSHTKLKKLGINV